MMKNIPIWVPIAVACASILLGILATINNAPGSYSDSPGFVKFLVWIAGLCAGYVLVWVVYNGIKNSDR